MGTKDSLKIDYIYKVTFEKLERTGKVAFSHTIYLKRLPTKFEMKKQIEYMDHWMPRYIGYRNNVKISKSIKTDII